MTTNEFEKQLHYIMNHKGATDKVKVMALRALAHYAGRTKR